MMPDSASPSPGTSAAVREEPWTTRRLLAWMSEHFKGRGIESPRVVAEMLLAHVIGCERMRLYMEADRPASPAELARLRELVARAAEHEPVQYLTGSAWFFGREFEVNRATLIPRPCTETVVEEALKVDKSISRKVEKSKEAGAEGGLDVSTYRHFDVSPLIADIGTGTGCIAITLAAQLKEAHIVATDIVPEALELAQRNAERHGVADRIEFVLGMGFDPLDSRDVERRWSPRSFDLICSNPPYISDAEWESEVDRTVKDFEPPSALRGGPDGLKVIAPLIAGAGARLKPGGRLIAEIGYSQREAVLDLVARSAELTDGEVVKDHEGLWRVLVARRK